MNHCQATAPSENSVSNPFGAASGHYENFPVASIFCPPELRRPIAAIYWFARTADDIADEGQAPAACRLAELAAYRRDLLGAARRQPVSDRWPRVFGPLSTAIGEFGLPVGLLSDLLDAFEQDIVFTGAGRRYQTDSELHDYCRRSANPIGRLLLHLYRVGDDESLAHSDRICTALQLINFWQDLGVDVARARWYPSVERMALHGVVDADLQCDAPCPRAARMVASYASDARAMVLEGSALVWRIPGRAGWELRLVVQGALRMLDKMQAMDHATWRRRAKLTRSDLPVLAWRALKMARPSTAATQT